MIAAVDPAMELMAREAVIDVAGTPDAVGEQVSVELDDHGFVLVRFASALPGYRGWLWTAVLTADEEGASLCEAYLLPGDDALLAPTWIPWSERVQPGDLDAAMVLPYIAEDPRLVPSYTVTDDADADSQEFFELGLGRERVLGPEGRDGVAERWYRGSHGPQAATAMASAAVCSTCAFYVPLTGSFRMLFGACANEWSPSDGRVVTVDHGCGAHSQTDAERRTSEWPAPDPLVDSEALVELDLQAPETQVEESPEASVEAASLADEVGGIPEADEITLEVPLVDATVGSSVTDTSTDD